MKAKPKAILLVVILWGIGLLVAAWLPANAQATTYSGDTAASGTPVFHRPQSFTQLSSLGIAFSYNTYSYTPPTTGSYRIQSSVSGNWDNFILVYSGSFNPAAPLTNLLNFNDDYGAVGQSGFAGQPLTAGTTYIIVTTGFQDFDSGAYTNTISPTIINGNTTGGATFARPASSDGMIDPTAPIYPVNAISSDANAVPYEAKTFSVTEAGLYRIQSEAIGSGYDPFTILYKGAFNPAQPLSNVVIANDDFGSFQFSGFEIGLDANQSYTLVTTGISNTQSGQYFWSVQKLYNFRAGFSGSTVGRSTVNIGSLSSLFDALSGAGNAVPFRAFRATFGAGGSYRFQLFSKTFSPTAYHPVFAEYFTPFNNTNLVAGVDLIYSNFPLLDTGEITLDTAGSLIFIVSGENNTDAGDFRLEAFGEGTVTLTPVAVVKGNVTLQTFVNTPPPSPRSFPVKFVFRPTSSGTDEIFNATLTSTNGNYLANVPEAVYNVGVKSLTLQKVISNVDATTGLVTGLNVSGLLGADSNDDNFTDIIDLLILINHYNQLKPAAGYSDAADYNFDGKNDIGDLLILISAYNQSGQFLP